MSQPRQVQLRPTHVDDLEFVLRAERDPEHSPFIRQWTDDHREGVDAFLEKRRPHFKSR